MRKFLFLFITVCGFLLPAGAQQKSISGTVTGAEDKLPIAGVTVQIRGTSAGVVTETDGKYRISAPQGATLEFRFVGMKTSEVLVDSSEVYDVSLEIDLIGVNEVLVIGYGTQIKSKVTGSIARVDGALLKNVPVSTVEQALQGKTAGVFIESINGKSTGTTNMRIRGSSSISATNQPLFVVDGIPLTTEVFNQTGGVINPLASINFNDVESIEILKDAASSAIYGSRGSNGVVIITTKKGINGETKLNFTIQSGYNEASGKRREFLNAEEYISYYREAAINGDIQEDIFNGNPIGTSDYWQKDVERSLRTFSGWAAIMNGDKYIGSQVNTDWQDLAFQKGRIFSADLSAQGGNDKLKYFTGLSYNNMEGIVISNGIEKISGRINVDNKVNKYIDIGFALSLNRNNIDQVSSDPEYSNSLQLVAESPVTPPRDLEGNFYNTPVTTYYNALLDVENATRNIIEYRSIANGYISFNIAGVLKWRNEFGFDLYNLKENAKFGTLTWFGAGINGYGLSNYVQNQNLNSKSYFDFAHSFGDFNLSALLGTEFQYTTIDNTSAEGQQFPLDELKTLASAGLITGATSTLTRYSFISYFTRVNLDYKAKYLLSLSGRIDGSSRFGENNRYGRFPAASLGWVLSKEDFLSGSTTLSFLKLRSSYGLTGNAGIVNSGQLGLYGVGSYIGLSGLIPTQVPNPDLGWESTNQLDLGIDYGFFKNRISGEVDYYIKTTDDLLLSVPVPSTSGYSTLLQNIGSVENKGFEFVINTSNFTGDLKWNTSLNISYNRNEVKYLGGQELIDNGGSLFMNVVKVGHPIGVFYGAEYAGVDPANGDALWYVNEMDEDGNIINHSATTNVFTDANFVVLGNPTPDLLGAICNSLRFKGVELSFTFQGVSGNKIHLVGDQYIAANSIFSYDNQLKSQLANWKKPGDITDVPQARMGWSNGNQSRNSRYLSEGSYLKLRSFSMSYELPEKLASKAGLDRIRIYVQGQNLLTFTKYQGWDPEVSTDFRFDYETSGCDFFSPPQARSMVFGITIGL